MNIPSFLRSPSWTSESRIIRLAYVLGALAFAPALTFAFVFDDQVQIVMNPWITSWKFLPLYFTTHFWQFNQDTGRYYRPMFHVWLRFNESLFGMIPAWWHLAGIAMHLLVVWLLYLVGKKILDNGMAAALGALLYAVHPVHMETVAWIAGVTEPLEASLLLAAFLAYLRWREATEHRDRWLALSVFVFTVAVFGKETAVIFPALAVIYELLMSRDAWRQRLQRSFRLAVPFALVSALYFLARHFAMRGATTPWTNADYLGLVVLEWPQLIWRYLWHMVWPFQLAFYYDYTVLGEASVLIAVLYGAALSLALAVFVWRFRRLPRVLFGGIIVLLPLTPILAGTFLWHPSVFLHDRYLYIPSMAVCLAAGWAGIEAWKRKPRLAMVGISALVVGLTLGTLLQVRQWDSDMTLFATAVKISPHNMLAREDLAMAYSSQGDFAGAVKQYDVMLQMRPESWNTMFSLAQTKYQMGDYATAASLLQRALAMMPMSKQRQSRDQYYLLGLALLKLGRAREAEAPLRVAIDLKPTAVGYHSALADALQKQGRVAEAGQAMLTEDANRKLFAAQQLEYGAEVREPAALAR